MSVTETTGFSSQVPRMAVKVTREMDLPWHREALNSHRVGQTVPRLAEIILV